MIARPPPASVLARALRYEDTTSERHFRDSMILELTTGQVVWLWVSATGRPDITVLLFPPTVTYDDGPDGTPPYPGHYPDDTGFRVIADQIDWPEVEAHLRILAPVPAQAVRDEVRRGLLLFIGAEAPDTQEARALELAILRYVTAKVRAAWGPYADPGLEAGNPAIMTREGFAKADDLPLPGWPPGSEADHLADVARRVASGELPAVEPIAGTSPYDPDPVGNPGLSPEAEQLVERAELRDVADLLRAEIEDDLPEPL